MRMAVAPMRHSRFRSSQKSPPSRLRYFASTALSSRSAVSGSEHARAAAARNTDATLAETGRGSQHPMLPVPSPQESSRGQSSRSRTFRQSAVATRLSDAHASYHRSVHPSSASCPRGNRQNERDRPCAADAPRRFRPAPREEHNAAAERRKPAPGVVEKHADILRHERNPREAGDVQRSAPPRKSRAANGGRYGKHGEEQSPPRTNNGSTAIRQAAPRCVRARSACA